MKNLVIVLLLTLMSCTKSQDIECYSIGYMDSIINHYENKIPDTVFIQTEDSLVNLYQDSLQMCRNILLMDVDGIDVVGSTYYFSIIDSTDLKIKVIKDNNFINVKVVKAYDKIELNIDDLDMWFSVGNMQDTVFVNDFKLEKALPDRWVDSTTVVLW